MSFSPATLSLIAVAVAAGLVGAIAALRRRGSGDARSPEREGAAANRPPTRQRSASNDVARRRLVEHAAHEDTHGYRIYVEFRQRAPFVWVAVSQVTAAHVYERDTGEPHMLNEVTAFVVGYPGGELADAHQAFAPLPEGLYARDFSRFTGELPPVIDDESLAAGARQLLVRHTNLRPNPERPGYLVYTSTLTNISNEPVRVLQFGAYHVRGAGRYVAPKHYTAEDFRSWYGIADVGGWIAPGQSVMDPTNWSVNRPVLWAYFFETRPGQREVTGEVVP